MSPRTIGTIEIVAGTLLAVLTLASPGTRIELYIVAAALFVSGHVVLAATWRRNSPAASRDEGRVVHRDMS